VRFSPFFFPFPRSAVRNYGSPPLLRKFGRNHLFFFPSLQCGGKISEPHEFSKLPFSPPFRGRIAPGLPPFLFYLPPSLPVSGPSEVTFGARTLVLFFSPLPFPFFFPAILLWSGILYLKFIIGFPLTPFFFALSRIF